MNHDISLEIEKKKRVDMSTYSSSFSLHNKLGRLLWNISYWLVFRPFSTGFFNSWRNSVLRLFGAQVGAHATIYSSVKIWAPWNLEIGEHSSMGPKVNCYNQGKIHIGKHTVISQKTYLCASGHDASLPNFPLILGPIEISHQVWVAADAFIGPGVRVGEGAVVGARAAVFKTVDPWTVVGGNPARFLKARVIR